MAEENKPSFFDRLKNTLGTKLKEASMNAINAYMKLSRQLAGKQANGNEIMRDPDRLIPRIQPQQLGRMCMYFYDPKWKEELPYFDRFPLVIPIEIYKDGFLGLNLHYLPYQMRMHLLYWLLQYKTNNKMDETTRLKFSWAAIKNVRKFAAAVPCFKNYSFGGLRSTFREIRAYEWATAVLLPVEQFVKLPDDRIWDKSRQYVNKINQGKKKRR